MTGGAGESSLQALIGRGQRAGFIGRRGELAAFRENFTIPPDDPRHRFVFHVHGAAGVGKTALVRELEQVAREHGALTAYADESAAGVPDTLAEIAAQCAAQGHRLKALDRLLTSYRRRRQEAESALLSEPEGPSTGSVAAARIGLAGLGLVPGLGPAVGGLDPAAVAEAADRLRTLLGARLRDQDDIQLLLRPERSLSPVLVEELAGLDVPWIVLFFDTYEQTGPYLDAWLRTLMTTSRYGPLPGRLVVVLSGQRPFDAVAWGAATAFVAELPLGAFSEGETRSLLAARGITDEADVEEVLRLSGGLPVLVSTLARSRPADPEGPRDPTRTAVEGFLRGERDPDRRAAALACALPRRLDEDVVRAVVGEPAEGLYDWLGALPFVTGRGGPVRYHDVVRGPMLRLQRGRAPRAFAERHARLAETFAAWRAEAATAAAGAGLPGHQPWDHRPWREARLEEIYHRLCSGPAALPAALADFAGACRAGPGAARRVARTLLEAGDDTDDDALRGWGRDLLAALGTEPGTAAALGLLLSRPGLTPAGRAVAHEARGAQLLSAPDPQAAAAAFDTALRLDPGLVPGYVGRAAARAAAGDLDAARADLDRADQLAPGTPSILVDRGELHRRGGDFAAGAADQDRALLLNPDNPGALASRGVCLGALGRTREARADLDRALELDPGHLWARVRRAHLSRAAGELDAAFADLDTAARAAPDSPWIASERGDAYRLAGRPAEALAEFDRALRLSPDYPSVHASRGVVLAALGRAPDALAALDRALELAPGYWWARMWRAQVRRDHGDTRGSLDDLDLLIAAEPDGAPARRRRAAFLLALGRSADAMADIDALTRLRPRDSEVLALRSEAAYLRGAYPEALGSAEEALALDPGHPGGLALLALVGLRTGRAGPTLSRLGALRAGGDATALRLSALLLLRAGRVPEALSLLDCAPGDGLEGLLAEAHRRSGNHAEARRLAAALRGRDEPEGLFQLALAETAAGDRDAALPLWRRLAALPVAPDAPDTATRAITAACARGDWPRADALLAGALTGHWGPLAELAAALAGLASEEDAPGHPLTERRARVLAALDARVARCR